LSCSSHQKWDNQTCQCACGHSEVCDPGYVFDDNICGCACKPKTCEQNFKLNQKSCECECDLDVVNTSCPSHLIFSYVTCQCEEKPSALQFKAC
jgi:hypothetical protein